MATRKSTTVIRKVTARNAGALLTLVDALARYEKLPPPAPAAKRRFLSHCAGPGKRFDAYIAITGGEAAGYALVFETYSSFLALPTLYLEDLFVVPSHRGRGAGMKLFRFCAAEAKRRGCGRMEWVVLDWNTGAKRFYRNLGARRLSSWEHYRLELRRPVARLTTRRHGRRPRSKQR
ncbi:MAG TPA: GNAT family N-acetyltransferase [Bacteroidota bacterium]|nr:GNAT family N-acetyltransferase [Bacteroidota bacterium]